MLVVDCAGGHTAVLAGNWGGRWHRLKRMPTGFRGASVSECRQNKLGSWAYILVAGFLSSAERKCRLLMATGGVWVGPGTPAVSVVNPASVRASYSAERVLT
jgi:hypothetical protein